MRNAALGDSLVRCFEQIGHPVIAANYFGDEGQHVATCLWQLKRETANQDLKAVLASVPPQERGEWLGGFYSRGVDALALDSLTDFPYIGVIAAKVKSKKPHPTPDAPHNWHVVQVVFGADAEATVVCGGNGYDIEDLVSYVPVGATFNGRLVVPLDKKGVFSHGIILSKKELDIEDEKEHVNQLSPLSNALAATESNAAETMKKTHHKETRIHQNSDSKVGHRRNNNINSDTAQKQKEETKHSAKSEKSPEAASSSAKASSDVDPILSSDAYSPVSTTVASVSSPSNCKTISSAALSTSSVAQAATRQSKKGTSISSSNQSSLSETATSIVHALTKVAGIAKEKSGTDAATSAIFVLNHLRSKGLQPGTRLTDFGRKCGVPHDNNKSIDQEWECRQSEVKAILRGMETSDKELVELWRYTAAWSFAEFARIYAWLGSRFDHDFKESDVGEASLRLIDELCAQGKLDKLPGAETSSPSSLDTSTKGENKDGNTCASDGSGGSSTLGFAVGLDLEKRGFKGHGFCLLRKSNGSGLYATKDLALAQVKFNDYKIDRSIYVVGDEQTHHFKQVFKSLEVLGYPQAKKCHHLAYGMVRLASGKMSSRKGTVVMFSSLRSLLQR